jgi:transposase InsO family protein
MSGRWLTLKQVELYMKFRREGKTQEVSAAKASISERTAREIDQGHRQDPHIKPRNWRTRHDPFEKVWDSELVPMLMKAPMLSPLTLLEYLQESHGYDAYPEKLLRTLQRKVKRWRHEEGPAREVIFRQEHIPGHMGLSDFTELKGISVTINNKPLRHLLYHFRMIYSGWSYMMVVLGGESFTALAEGLQNALWCLGGSPKEHRTDSLSAAYKNLTLDEQADLTQQYQDFCAHYTMIPSRNNKGVSHENGGIESPHGHIKKRIAQAFLIRGSYDFKSVEAYQAWIEQVVQAHNRRNAKSVEVEKMALQPLPSYKTTDYTVLPVKVSSSSTIQVRTSLYTVPSRLVGATLQVHLYHDHLKCFYGSTLMTTIERVYGQDGLRRAKNIDYRHVIDSLVKKPMAFYKSVHRDALLPNACYKNIWEIISSKQSSREASKFMVGLLHLAAITDKEQEISEKVMGLLDAGKEPTLSELRHAFGESHRHDRPSIESTQHHLSDYNSLIPTAVEVSHVLH